MPFVADDLGAWLVATLADAASKKLIKLVFGTEQERALRSAATAAVELTARELRPDDDEQAEYLASVISEVFRTPVPGDRLAGHETVLGALQAGISGQLNVLEDPSVTGMKKSSLQVLGIPAGTLAPKLTDRLLLEIVLRGAQGGPMFPLASQLNDDRTHIKIDQLDKKLVEVLDRLPPPGVAQKPAVSAQAESPKARCPPGRAQPTVTDRWRYTPPVTFDVPALANIGNIGFSHPSYTRHYEDKPPAVRVGTFVACSALGEDEPTEEELRARFQALLEGEPFSSLIRLLTNISLDAEWQSQPGSGRFKLESDLRGKDASKAPVASAMLLLPDAGRKGAELVLHIDLPTQDGVPVKAKLARWHERFTAALAVPADLARFLEELGLTATDDPAARFAIQVQARTVVAAGMDEIVDTQIFAPLSKAGYSPQFDGWAVADPGGGTARAISKKFLRELCKGMGRTASEIVLLGFPD